MIFGSFGRSDDLGGGDLYFSNKDAFGNWKKAKNMGSEVNSEVLDYCPFIDMPRRNFYFTSERANPDSHDFTNVSDLIDLSNSVLNGMGNIYRINLEKLDLNYPVKSEWIETNLKPKI